MSSQLQKRRRDYEKWLDNNGIEMDLAGIDAEVLKVLYSNGIKVPSIYEEEDPLKIRLYVSDLVIKRDQYNTREYLEFIRIVIYLLSYAEYLEKKLLEKTDSERPSVSDMRDQARDTLTVAYYLSRVNKEALKQLHYKSFKDAFEQLSILLKQKPSTIKNMRDEFDPYFDNGRVGWYQRQLAPSRKAVFDKYKNATEEELYKTVKAIIEAYQITGTQDELKDINNKQESHHRIRITNNSFKEIKKKR